jgi:hypothetical protein
VEPKKEVSRVPENAISGPKNDAMYPNPKKMEINASDYFLRVNKIEIEMRHALGSLIICTQSQCHALLGLSTILRN